MYDPQIGRWHRVDPMAENHFSMTPYNYVLNNPLAYIDLFGLDTTKVVEIPPAYCTAQRRYKTPPNLNFYSSGSSSQAQDNSEDSSPVPKMVADATSVAGFIKSTGIEYQKLTGIKAGKLSNAYRIYGSNFYGNQSTKIVKLSKTVKVGGIVIDAIVVSADVYDAYFNGKAGAEQATAEQKLIRDILMVGVYAINAEAGILLTVGQIFMNSEETQRMVRQNEIDRNRSQGLWQLPQGPTYIERGE